MSKLEQVLDSLKQEDDKMIDYQIYNDDGFKRVNIFNQSQMDGHKYYWPNSFLVFDDEK